MMMMHNVIMGVVLAGLLLQAMIPEEDETVNAEAQQLVERIERNDRRAILELGRLGLRHYVPYLRNLYEAVPDPDTTAEAQTKSYAQMALAKLGERDQFDEIVRELTSDDPIVQAAAVDKLIYIEGDESIVALGKLLDEPLKYRSAPGFDPDARGPQGEIPQDRVIVPPVAWQAAKALSHIVSDPPEDFDERLATEEYVEVWRRWWAENKDRYLDPPPDEPGADAPQ